MVKKEKLWRELGESKDLMKGSLALTARKCGKKKCSCQKGALHPGHYFSYFFRGKPHVLYVPESLVPKIKELAENWKEKKALIEETTRLNAGLIKRRNL